MLLTHTSPPPLQSFETCLNGNHKKLPCPCMEGGDEQNEYTEEGDGGRGQLEDGKKGSTIEAEEEILFLGPK